MRTSSNSVKVVGAVTGGILLVLGFVIIVYQLYLTNAIQEGIIIDKIYEGGSVSTGNVFDTDGNMSIVTTSKSERYIILVDGINLKGNKKVGSVNMKAEEWVKLSKGDKFDRNNYK